MLQVIQIEGGQFFRVFPEERFLIKEEQINLGFDLDLDATEFINSDKVLPQIRKLAPGYKSKDKAIMLSLETCNEITLAEDEKKFDNDID